MNCRALIVCAALVACGGAKPVSVSSGWAEYKTDHFILDTDAGDADARSILANFEALRAADLKVLAGDQADFAGHIRLIVPSASTFAGLTHSRNVAAFYTHGVHHTDPVIVAPPDFAIREPQVAAHELAHAVSFYLFPEQRHWFIEGVAEFIESLGASRAKEADGGTAVSVSGTFGDIPWNMQGFAGREEYQVHSEKLLAWNGVEDPVTPGLFHAHGWLLYSWLWNTRGKDLTAFQQQLADGRSWDEAWASSFPDLDPADHDKMRALDRSILLYRRVGRFLKGKIEVKEPFHVEKAAVSRATVRLWMIRLKNDWPADEQKRKLAYRVEIEQARAEDPDNAQVIIDVASLDRKVTEADAREAVRRSPGQYDGWFALGDLAEAPADKEQAFRKAVELEPDCAACNNSLAWFLVKNGRAKEALPYANRAVDLAPWAGYIIDTLAEVALQLGRCTEAVQLQTRATRILISQGWKKEKREAHLASYREQCAKK